MKAQSEFVVRAGESIQSAIERIPEGGIIRLGEGSWEESLVIDKSLTLCGAGKENTSIRAGSSEGEQNLLSVEENAEGDLPEELGFLVTRAGGRMDVKGMLPSE